MAGYRRSRKYHSSDAGWWLVFWDSMAAGVEKFADIQCNICQMKFQSKYAKQQYDNYQHDPSAFSCRICSKLYRRIVSRSIKNAFGG